MQSELMFTINRRNDQISSSEHEIIEDSVCSNDNRELKILCFVWRNCKIGAAYFDFSDKMLYVYEEMADVAPQFFVTRSLYREVNPHFVITRGQTCDEFVKFLIDTISLGDGATTSSDSERTLPPNLFLLPSKEYTLESCKNLLYDLIFTHDSEKTDVEKELYIHSLINFDYKLTVQAAMSLIKYLDKNWAFFTENRDDLQILHIEQTSMRGHVLMDLITFNALQVFQECSHEAGFKRGVQSSNHEGLSIFRLFSSNCKSKLGQACLKNLLLKPLNDIEVLRKRLDFITFVLHPAHQEFIESLQDNIKALSDITIILQKIKNSRANYKDWKILYKCMYHAVFTSELSAPYKKHCHIIGEFIDSVTTELIGLENSIANAIDFSDNKYITGRPTIKFGLDQYLDAKKLRRQDIAQHVNAAAKIAVHQLPDFIQECTVIYLPEMGHLIGIKEWASDCNPDDLKELGFQFMFTLRGTIHYKNPLCRELDANLGDINAEIIAHENRILQRLSTFIVRYNKDIRQPLTILSLMDALIALAKVAAQNNYVRPNLNDENIHEVQDCRHPLMELSSQFEANDFYSGSNYSHIKIITGPNGSGKSVYLKQVALTIYLAHIGSYVPAKSANIAMMHSIHTRMHAAESASVRLSAFMIDVIQASQALFNARGNSLILLDEFGRSTVSDDGFALLVGILKKFQRDGENCPHILVSTHLQKIGEYLPENQLIDHFQMTYSMENGMLLFLYKIRKGISRSFAFDIALSVGLDQDVVKRAREFFDNETMQPLPNVHYPHPLPFSSEEQLMNFLLNVDVPQPDNI